MWLSHPVEKSAAVVQRSELRAARSGALLLPLRPELLKHLHQARLNAGRLGDHQRHRTNFRCCPVDGRLPVWRKLLIGIEEALRLRLNLGRFAPLAVEHPGLKNGVLRDALPVRIPSSADQRAPPRSVSPALLMLAPIVVVAVAIEEARLLNGFLGIQPSIGGHALRLIECIDVPIHSPHFHHALTLVAIGFGQEEQEIVDCVLVDVVLISTGARNASQKHKSRKSENEEGLGVLAFCRCYEASVDRCSSNLCELRNESVQRQVFRMRARLAEVGPGVILYARGRYDTAVSTPVRLDLHLPNLVAIQNPD
mmetsp:Transcript_110471/g.236043  ORF Transcript_110471/g.236043 Transcript_110471/m.236043 type:complete len:310 (+) Transcript_110471:34-963(+)